MRIVFENTFEETWSRKCGNRKALATNGTQECFREYIRGNMEHRAVIGLPLPPLSSRLSDGAVRGKLSLLKLSRVATEFDVVKRKRMERSPRLLGQAKRQSRACYKLNSFQEKGHIVIDKLVTIQVFQPSLFVMTRF